MQNIARDVRDTAVQAIMPEEMQDLTHMDEDHLAHEKRRRELNLERDARMAAAASGNLDVSKLGQVERESYLLEYASTFDDFVSPLPPSPPLKTMHSVESVALPAAILHLKTACLLIYASCLAPPKKQNKKRTRWRSSSVTSLCSAPSILSRACSPSSTTSSKSVWTPRKSASFQDAPCGGVRIILEVGLACKSCA